jgi:CMP-N-acetylneuraminic acid synthetase
MFNNNMILVVIPARGGSKGIPRKNLRLLNNKPLISYSIEIAKASQYVDDVVVTTDDSQIALIAEKFGASVIRRSEELSTDEVPLDPVIHDAMIQKEKLAFDEYDIVITLQPTSPLIKPESLDKVIEKFEDFSIDSVISVVDDRNLSWGYDENNQRYFPNYIERCDKQDLPVSLKETGAILATRRSFVHENSRLGTNIGIVEVSREESVNIEEYEDWWLAENYLKKKRIAIVVNANEEIGTSHMDRCITIASKLVFHEVLFLIDEHYQLGIDMTRCAIGLVVSICFLYFVPLYKYMSERMQNLVCTLGRYSIGIYCLSMIILHIVYKVMGRFDINISHNYYYPIALAIFVVTICTMSMKFCEKRKILNILFLGGR